MSMSSAVGLWIEQPEVPPAEISAAIAQHAGALVEAKLRLLVYARATPPATFASVHFDGEDGPLATEFDALVPVAQALASKLKRRTWAFGGFAGTAQWLEVVAFDAKGAVAWKSKGESRAPYTRFVKDLGTKGTYFTTGINPFLEASEDWARRANRTLGVAAPDYRHVRADSPEAISVTGRALAADRVLLRTQDVARRRVSELWARVSETPVEKDGRPKWLRRFALVPAPTSFPGEWADLDHDGVPEGLTVSGNAPLLGLPSIATGADAVVRDVRLVDTVAGECWLRVVAAKGPVPKAEASWIKSSMAEAERLLSAPDCKALAHAGDAAPMLARAHRAALLEALEDVVAIGIEHQHWPMLAALNAAVDETRSLVDSALSDAVVRKDEQRVRGLLSVGLPDEARSYGWYPVMSAVRREAPAIVEVFRAAGASLRGLDRHSGRSALHHASTPAMIKYLVEQQKLDPNVPDRNGETPLMLQVYERAPITLDNVRELLAQGASIDVSYGKTPLMERLATIVSNRKGADGKVTRQVLKLLEAELKG